MSKCSKGAAEKKNYPKKKKVLCVKRGTELQYSPGGTDTIQSCQIYDRLGGALGLPGS